MVTDDSNSRKRAAVAAVDQQDLPLPWLLRAKVSVPPRAPRYLERPDLLERAMPTGHRLVLLRAPGGFGKTTLIAECCRRLAAQRVTTAWLSIDEQDSADMLDIYLAFAFQHAGLDAVDVLAVAGKAIVPFDHRLGLVMSAIEAHGDTCVLVIDELERLTDPDSVDLINFLLRRSPANLHVALVCRKLPEGVNLAETVLDGTASVLTVDDLRFSKTEIEHYFGGELSRRQLAALVAESNGWPIALQIYGNQRTSSGTEPTLAVRDVVENWVESRLFAAVSGVDRDMVLDLGLFDWFDGHLLDAVFGGVGNLDRIQSLPALEGLLETLRPAPSEAWRLHSLVGVYCARKRLRDSPDRFRAIHRRIALAIAERGDAVSAMGHAAKAQDTELVGEILTSAGGVRLWIREGLVSLQRADRLLSREIFDARPRLALARCAVLFMTGRLEEARRLFVATEGQTKKFSRDPGGADFDLQVDRCLVEGILYVYSGEPVDSVRAQRLRGDIVQLVDDPATDPRVRASFEYGLCLTHNLRAEFDAAVLRAERTLHCLGGDPAYLSLFVDLQLGQMAMAQGRTADARQRYTGAQSAAKAQFLRDPGLLGVIDALMKELDLECNLLRHDRGKPIQIPKTMVRSGTPFAAFAAVSGVVAESTLASRGVDAALSALGEMLGFARRGALRSLRSIVSAHRVELIAGSGRMEEARRLWRLDDMPVDADGCLTLKEQGWREMEAISCAWLRLLIGGKKFEEGRLFLDRLIDLCAERGLRRTEMRGLALGIVLEHRASNPVAGNAHLSEFLRLFEDSRYARPLVREREVAHAALNRFLATDATEPNSSAWVSAQGLLTAIAANELGSGDVSFSSREIQVLQRLETHRDREIALALGLSVDGVRYHLRNIFAKTGAQKPRKRMDAVRRARSLGVWLPE